MGRGLLLKYSLQLLPSGESCFVLQSRQTRSLVANFPQCLLLAVCCVCRASGSIPADPVLAGTLFHSSKKKKKKKFLVGFDQCGFTAWQRKSSKYSNNTATVTPVLLQRTSDNRSSVVLSTGLGVLHCSAGMRLRLGRGSAHTHNTCSVMTCTPKSTRYTKYSPPILLYYTIAYVYTCI